MRVLFSIIIISLVNLLNAEENNVCGTFKDYYTIKTNPKCWYDVAADLKLVSKAIRFY